MNSEELLLFPDTDTQYFKGGNEDDTFEDKIYSFDKEIKGFVFCLSLN
jgi:hypothetical protein